MMSAERRFETVETTAGRGVKAYEAAESAEGISERISRPKSVTCLAAAVLIMAGVHLVRFIQSLRQWDFLASLPAVHPLYTALTGLFWFGFLFLLGIGLLRGLRWAPRLTWLAALLYLAYFWLDRLLFVEPFGADGRDPALPFLAGSTILGLVLLYGILRRKSARRFFGEIHE